MCTLPFSSDKLYIYSGSPLSSLCGVHQSALEGFSLLRSQLHLVSSSFCSSGVKPGFFLYCSLFLIHSSALPILSAQCSFLLFL